MTDKKKLIFIVTAIVVILIVGISIFYFINKYMFNKLQLFSRNTKTREYFGKSFWKYWIMAYKTCNADGSSSCRFGTIYAEI